MKKNKLKVLDCTLRDGGYYNNWNFSIHLINKYLKVMSDIKVDYVEIGFRSLERKEFRGPCAYTTDQFLNDLKIPKTLKVGVMINGAELIKANTLKKNTLLISSLFKKAKFSKVKLVRIASHYSELSKVMPVASKIKSLGYKVAINLMQISDRTENEIKQFCDLAKKYNMDAVYFADSTGSLNRYQTLEIVKNFKKNWKADLGIHAHDNMDMAMENAMMALNNGVSWIDSTVLGMGRGPGNVKTENLVLELEKIFKRKVNYNSLIKLIEDDFIPMKNKYGWGSNVYYYLSGLYGIHPSFIQGMLSANLTIPRNSKGGSEAGWASEKALSPSWYSYSCFSLLCDMPNITNDRFIRNSVIPAAHLSYQSLTCGSQAKPCTAAQRNVLCTITA